MDIMKMFLSSSTSTTTTSTTTTTMLLLSQPVPHFHYTIMAVLGPFLSLSCSTPTAAAAAAVFHSTLPLLDQQQQQPSYLGYNPKPRT